MEAVCNSIQKALPLILKYRALAEEVDQSPNKKHIKSVGNPLSGR